MDSTPTVWPFWAGIFAAIVEKKGGQVGILDLNALRMKYDGSQVPIQVISDEISAEKWDLIGIGGLTTTYGRIKELCSLIKKCSPNSLLVSGGGWATYNPDEILQLVPELDLICIGEGEETFSEIYDEMEHGTNDFEKINGLCMRDGNNLKFTAPRALISDLNTVPFPAVHLFEHEIYLTLLAKQQTAFHPLYHRLLLQIYNCQAYLHRIYNINVMCCMPVINLYKFGYLT